MIQIDKKIVEKKYERKLEDMGEFLVFVEIKKKKYNSQYNYHFFYQNMKKPPLDVAINPNDYTIEYISFFFQNEVIKEICFPIEPIFLKESISILCDVFSIDNMYIWINENFSNFIFNRSLMIIKDKIENDVYGYICGKDNYILISNNEIVGIYLGNISNAEMEALKNAKVIQK